MHQWHTNTLLAEEACILLDLPARFFASGTWAQSQYLFPGVSITYHAPVCLSVCLSYIPPRCRLACMYESMSVL